MFVQIAELARGYCRSLLGRTECKETTASGTEAQLSCEGGTWCTFSKSTEGNHSVPAPGCTLSQMVTVSGTMNVSGVAGASPLHELAAVGGTPDASNPKRHFTVPAGSMLRISHLRMEGGRVVSTNGESNENRVGGSIKVIGASAILFVKSVLFAGCGDNVCARHAGAVSVDNTAQNGDIRFDF